MGSSSCRSRRTAPSRRCRFALAALAAATAGAGIAQAQDLTGNLTSLTGTWSSGTGAVLTGPGFAQPTNFTFTYPNNTGIALSFTDDGHFEEAQYRFEANGTEPHCVKAIVIWQHGNYTIQPNNSITFSPIESDGRIQVQDPCASETNVITYYYEPTLWSGWAITNDLNHNRFMLQLLRFDGSLFPRLYLWYRPPTMLPTEQLWTTAAYQAYEKQRGSASGSVRVDAVLMAVAAGLASVVGLAWTGLA